MYSTIGRDQVLTKIRMLFKTHCRISPHKFRKYNIPTYRKLINPPLWKDFKYESCRVCFYKKKLTTKYLLRLILFLKVGFAESTISP